MESVNDPMSSTWVDWDQPIELDDGTPVTFMSKEAGRSRTYYRVHWHETELGYQNFQRNGRPKNREGKRWVRNCVHKYISLPSIGLDN
jgi:hypothetical protein